MREERTVIKSFETLADALTKPHVMVDVMFDKLLHVLLSRTVVLSRDSKKAEPVENRGFSRGRRLALPFSSFARSSQAPGATRSCGARAGKIFNCHRTVGRSPSQVRPFFKATLVNKSAAQPLQAARRIPNMERSTI